MSNIQTLVLSSSFQIVLAVIALIACQATSHQPAKVAIKVRRKE